MAKTKFSTEEIQQVLESTVPADEAAKILRKLQNLSDLVNEDDEKEPKPKWNTIILQKDGNYSSPDEVPSVVLQIPETDNHNLVVDKIQKAYHDYRSEKGKKKRSKMTIDTIFAAVQYLPKKYLKANNVKIVNSQVTTIVTTNNILNTQEQSFGE